MAVLIEDAEAERLIRELVSRTREGVIEAVRVAVDIAPAWCPEARTA